MATIWLITIKYKTKFYQIQSKGTHWLGGRWWSSSLYGSITSPLTPWRKTAIFARSRTQFMLGRESFSHLFHYSRTNIFRSSKKQDRCTSYYHTFMAFESHFNGKQQSSDDMCFFRHLQQFLFAEAQRVQSSVNVFMLTVCLSSYECSSKLAKNSNYKYDM